jgi:YYY domain-containing protein
VIALNLITWYLAIGLAGWLALPLAYRLFSFLPDRGLALARPLGLLLWGYAYWMLVSLHVLQNDAGGVFFGLFVLAGLSVWTLRKGGLNELLAWLREKKSYVQTTELIFLAAFAIWAFVRSTMPEASGTEKPMELAFINAILRSPTFPPRDPWLSGYAISYYYFGYVIVAMLARTSFVSGAVAFNLALASWFALTALAAFGLLYNLLALRKLPRFLPMVSGLLAPFFILLAGNLEGFLEILHAKGIFWSQQAGGIWQSPFWKWLDIQELVNPPSLPLSWTPTRISGIWWWRASRVLQDYALDGSTREVIDEFPMFSYLLGDLHPHVLAMPFALLAVGLALNIFLQLKSSLTGKLSLMKWFASPEFWVAALALGGLSFLNTWDFPIYLALFAAAVALAGLIRNGWNLEAFLDFILTIVPLGVAGGILYLPFYLTFSSQANGFLPSLVFFTRGIHFWVMFGVLLLPIIAWLAWSWRRGEIKPAVLAGVVFAVALVGGLWLLSFLYGIIRLKADPGLAGIWGAVEANRLFVSGLLERFVSPGAWITLIGLLALAWGLIQAYISRANVPTEPSVETETSLEKSSPGSDPFVLLIFLLGTGLVLFPEFFYLRDQFGFRMNTIFKFYFQAWILWAIVAGYASAVLLSELRKPTRFVFSAGWGILVLISLPYAVYGIWSRTGGFQTSDLTLDGSAYIERYAAGEMEAIHWLQNAPYGVVTEAIGGSYSGFARISTMTGLPTVLGWPGHESQWRGGAKEIGSREPDIAQLYRAKNWTQASQILTEYQVRYLYVGAMERSTYRPNEEIFQSHMSIAFQNNEVTIYEFQPSDSTQGQAVNP